MSKRRVADLMSEGCYAGLNLRTVALWQAIYDYVMEYKFADLLDDRFVDLMTDKFQIGKATIGRHLNRMVKAELLSRWEMVRKPGQVRMIFAFFQGIHPTRLVRYTLPGKKPPLDMYRER